MCHASIGISHIVLSGTWELARPERFELPTTAFEAQYSIQLSYGRVRTL
jgi:hypothetical protein